MHECLQACADIVAGELAEFLAERAHGDDRLRHGPMAARASDIGKEAAHSVPLLAGCVKEHILEVRLAAIRALGNIGPDAKAAVPPLLDAARESQTDIREAATDALKKIQSPAGTAEKP